jgi:undecaprenyl diphosphate synthase
MKTIEHIAIIMDGNGRWAQKRRRPRVWGHIRGANMVSDIVTAASKSNQIKALTLYGFSTENWSRPLPEIKSLFKLLKKFLLKEREKMIRNNVQFEIIGDISKLEQETKDIINEIEAVTKTNTGLKLSLAFSYGGRQEILDSVNSHIMKNPGKPVTFDDIEMNLYRPEVGDVDLLIRTAGDKRISNFLLWQLSYAELYFSDTLWPEFTVEEFESIINEVAKRERRFGSVGIKNTSLDNSFSIAKENITRISNGGQ